MGYGPGLCHISSRGKKTPGGESGGRKSVHAKSDWRVSAARWNQCNDCSAAVKSNFIALHKKIRRIRSFRLFFPGVL